MNGSIVNVETIKIEGLSKEGVRLLDKIADATGGIFKPWQIVRVAKAQAKVKKIEAISQIEVTELHIRAYQRFLNEEAKKQDNIEKITSLALPLLDGKAKPEDMDSDWITNFFDKSRLISDAQMQDLWSRILAGEANNPGSYSKRTVNFMASLDKEDAALFTKLCNFNCIINDLHPLVFDPSAEIYNKNGVNFGVLTHLETIGLISFDNLQGYIFQSLPQKILISYQDTPLILEFIKPEENTIEVGRVLLTGVGRDLARICTTEKIIDFEAYIIRQWMNHGIRISSPYNYPPLNMTFMEKKK